MTCAAWPAISRRRQLASSGWSMPRSAELKPQPPPAANCPSWLAPAAGLYRDALPVLELLGSLRTRRRCWQCPDCQRLRAICDRGHGYGGQRGGGHRPNERASTFLECCTAGSIRRQEAGCWAAAQAKLLNRDFEPDLPAGAALAPLEVASQQAWRTGTTARLLAGKRARTLPAVGSSRPEQSGSDVDLPVPESCTAP